MADKPYYSQNRLTIRDGKWCYFDCCGRCPLNVSDDDPEACKPDYWFFSKEDNDAIILMTDSQREKLTIGKFEGVAWFRVPEPDWEEEMEKCVSSPYYFYTHFIHIKTEDGLKPATTRLTEEEFNKYFLELGNKEKITGKPD